MQSRVVGRPSIAASQQVFQGLQSREQLKSPPLNYTIVVNPEQRYWKPHAEHLQNALHWPASIYEYAAWKRAFLPGDFNLVVAIDHDKDEIIGSLTVSNYQPNEVLNQQPLSMLGLYSVRDEVAGRGIGSALFSYAQRLCHSWQGGIGTPSMSEKYVRKYHYALQPWFVHTPIVEMRQARPDRLPHDSTLKIQTPEDCGWQAISDYYESYLPYFKCGSVACALLSEEGAEGLVATSGDDDQVVAMIRVRKLTPQSVNIGPLLAETPLAASTILRAALDRFTDEHDANSRIILEIPAANSHMHHLLNTLSNGTYTMDEEHFYRPQYTQPLQVPMEKVYAMSQLSMALI